MQCLCIVVWCSGLLQSTVGPISLTSKLVISPNTYYACL